MVDKGSDVKKLHEMHNSELVSKLMGENHYLQVAGKVF